MGSKRHHGKLPVPYINMKFKKSKSGNIIVPIIKGHLAIPITNKKYELFGNYEANLTRKDFENAQGKWKDTFKRIYNDKLSKIDFLLINSYLPDLIYKKFKKEEPGLFKETNLMNICLIHIFKDFSRYSILSFLSITAMSMSEVLVSSPLE